MVRVSTAFAVLLAACWPAAVVCAAPPVLSLDDAFARVLDHHPSLRLIDARRDRLEAGQDQAALRPALRLGMDLENVLGSGDYSGVSGAEAGLTLASVLERGGKREARQALAAARVNALGMTRQAQRLDLLAEVTRRYLDLADAQARATIADDAIVLRQRTLDAARLRHRIGAAPESSALAAEAAVARAMLSRERALLDAQASWRRLALLWGGAGTDEPPATVGTVTALPDVAPVDTLLSLIDSTPALLRFADETRVREARLRLAETRRTPDLDWQIGVRRLQADGDVALMAGISLPLGSRARAEPQVRSARAELAELSIEHEVTGLELRAAVLEAHGRYQGARAEVERIDTTLLPLLERTERAADAAFRAGALPWLEWAQVQADIVAAQGERLAAALEGRRALIELQRLTAEPIVLPADREQELQP
jgi:cobalt-zinc-cadmium efflux system outer membrane protein